MLLGIFTTANVTINCPNTSDWLAVFEDCGLPGEQPAMASERIKGRRNFMFRNYLRIDALSSFPTLPPHARPFPGCCASACVSLPPSSGFGETSRREKAAFASVPVRRRFAQRRRRDIFVEPDRKKYFQAPSGATYSANHSSQSSSGTFLEYAAPTGLVILRMTFYKYVTPTALGLGKTHGFWHFRPVFIINHCRHTI